MQPLVSIIVPTHNRAHLIGETLDAVLAQTYENWECIVVDDGSIDYTDELLEFYGGKDSRIQYHQRPKNRKKGANACRNYGLELSKGEFINWFDSDDLMHPNKLQNQIQALRNTSLNLSICSMHFFSDSIHGHLEQGSKNIYSESPFEDYIMGKMGFLTSVPLWKKEFLQNYNLRFDENLQAAQEWEFHTRILYLSPTYNVIEKPLVFVRKHQESISYAIPEKNNRIWNYYFARYRIYSNKNIQLNLEVKQYLQHLFLSYFKINVRSQDLKYARKAFFVFLWKEKQLTISMKIKAFIGIFSYKLFKKGNVFLKDLYYIN